MPDSPNKQSDKNAICHRKKSPAGKLPAGLFVNLPDCISGKANYGKSTLGLPLISFCVIGRKCQVLGARCQISKRR